MHLQSGKALKFDINPTKRPFYAACNSIFMHGSGVDKIALLSLQESYVLFSCMLFLPWVLLKGKLMNWMCAGILLYTDYLVITDGSLLAQSYLD